MKLQSISRMLIALNKQHVFVKADATDDAEALDLFNKSWLLALRNFANICDHRLLQGEYNEEANSRWNHKANKLLEDIDGLAYTSQVMITRSLSSQPVSLDVRKKTVTRLKIASMMFAKDHSSNLVEEHKARVIEECSADIRSLNHALTYAQFILKAARIARNIVTEQLTILVDFQLNRPED